MKAFEQCPKQFYHMKIAKDYKEPYTEAMRYGTELHAVAEDFIRDGTPIPNKFAFLKSPLEALERSLSLVDLKIKMCGGVVSRTW